MSNRISKWIGVGVMGLSLILAPAVNAHQTGSSHKHSKKKVVKIRSGSRVRVQRDVNQIQPLLLSASRAANVESNAWLRVANEANMLANRIRANAKTSRSTAAINAATELRTHVREMHKAVVSGDSAGAREHARMALPFTYILDDWSA